MLRELALGLCVCVTACYTPSFRECAIGCDTATGCPSGLSCDMGSHLCSSAGTTCTGGGDDAQKDGAGSDSGSGGGSCAWSFTPTNFDPCDPNLPAATTALDVSSAGTTIDTAVCSQYVFQSQAPVCVKHYTSVDIEGALAIRGELPLIIISDGNLTIRSTVIANGVVIQPPPACNAPIAVGGTSSTAGGAGGGHAINGGTGGAGVGGAGTTTGGFAYGIPALAPLEPGCPGGNGGDVNGFSGTGGNGGGALELSAQGTIQIAGLVTVNGDGGLGGPFSGSSGGGGGGGGTGGSILVEGAQVTVTGTAQLCAIGGSGGQGGAPGSNIGASGSTASACLAPSGGGTAGSIGSGGLGGTKSAPGAGLAGNTTRGGGGGGGAGGRVRIHSIATPSLDPNAPIVPAPALL